MTAPTSLNELRRRVMTIGRDAGLSRVGICVARPLPDVGADLRARSATGFSAGMAFTFAHPEISSDVTKSFSWARRLVVGAYTYLSGNPGSERQGTGRVARFATEDHYVPLRTALGSIAAHLESAGHRAVVLSDDNRLVDRAAAVEAGIGWWGKNTMVLAPGDGPWFLLGSVVTDAELAVDQPMRRDCGTCDACLPACPTEALVSPGVLDARRCLAALAQGRSPIPPDFRVAMGDRVYGCDDCLEACPPGRRLLETEPSDGRGRVDLEELLAIDDDALLARFEHFYVPGRRVRYLRRNLLIAVGNAGTQSHIPLLTRYLDDSDPMLRAHAAWAMGRIGGASAIARLRERHAVETDAEVTAEIRNALAG